MPTTDPAAPASVADHALLSDCQGAALVDRAGTVAWACLPRFDSPSTFARILDPGAGHWHVRPAAAFSTERAYLPATMVLRTVFTTATGAVAVTDALALGPDERGHGIGRRAPHALVRVVEGLSGAVELDVELAPRPEYGLTTPLLSRHGAGVRSRGGPQSYVVSSDVRLDLDAGVARARPTVAAGETLAFSLRVCSPWEEPPAPWDGAEVRRLLDATVEGWRSWSVLHQSYEGPYAEAVHASGRVLQALTHAPTGAVVAAPTTSLPEAPGAGRNWDYRYSWVRDASLTLEALWVAACPDEAERFFEFFVTAAGGSAEPDALQVVYGVGGERRLAESELAHLDGHRGSRPVRVGNGAWDQVQLDIYGELLSAADVLAARMDLADATAAFLADLADAAANRWEETDRGIWEVRGEPRHFLHSKLMCWVALDRALRLAPRLGAGADRVARWEDERARIRGAICERGWSEEAGAYAQSFGAAALDASALLLPIVGFVDAADERMRATIEAVARELTDERGLVYRYRADDDLEGEESSFGICSFWLVQCWALLGEVERASALFDAVAGCANDVGLLAEEISPDGELLGNFPQAFTHVGLVNAAWALAQAKEAGGR